LQSGAKVDRAVENGRLAAEPRHRLPDAVIDEVLEKISPAFFLKGA
jgi:hypothetical protein